MNKDMSDKFLGRKLNTNTMVWEYEGGSGYPCPEEMRQEVFLAHERRNAMGCNGIWFKRLKINIEE